MISPYYYYYYRSQDPTKITHTTAGTGIAPLVVELSNTSPSLLYFMLQLSLYTTSLLGEQEGSKGFFADIPAVSD